MCEYMVYVMLVKIIDEYLAIINIIGFFAFLINCWLYSHTPDKEIDKALTVISFIGGAAGILIAILLFDRKAVKGNMMSRVFVGAIFVIQTVIFLYINGVRAESIKWNIVEFFSRHIILVAYLVIINFMTLILFAVDKINAIEKRTRIRIVTLLGLAFIGGSIGGFVAMRVFKHKTKKDYFSIGIPLIMIMQIVVIIYLMNSGIPFLS